MRDLMKLKPLLAALFVACLATPLPARASGPVMPRPIEVFTLDPVTVQREGPAYRYPQAGWTVVHIEGGPYERGRQHGTLLAGEIAAFVKCNALAFSAKNPSDAWKMNRTLVDALFVRRFDPELLEEMRGIADGAAAGGAKFEGRAIDLTDIVAINVWPEIMCLDSAGRATPTGLEGKRFGETSAPHAPGTTQPERCSAFAATGAATKDGKVVIGHITMFDLYPSNFSNVMLDVKPSKGHRVLIQTSPGGVQSGLDWYQNDAGMVLTETTISQTAFDPAGMSIGSRSRMAMQYGDTIDRVVEILSGKNNGLYTNEWLLADTKTNEIAMLELGTRARKLWRSGKSDWFAGTEGFYWGCNNTKDAGVRLDTMATTNDAPGDSVFACEGRDCKWVELYKANKGKIDAEFGRMALSTPPLASTTSADAKVTTSELAASMSAYAVFGPAGGRAWKATEKEKQDYPDVVPLPPNAWTQLNLVTPAAAKAEVVLADGGKAGTADHDVPEADGDDETPDNGTPLYRGTFLPATGADVWLAGAFPSYEGTLRRVGKDGATKPGKVLAQALRGAAAKVEYAARQSDRAPISSAPSDELPSRVDHQATLGRGLLVLHALDVRMGHEAFLKFMDDFGTGHAGKLVTTAEFTSAAGKAGNIDLASFFHAWLETSELPKLALTNVSCSEQRGKKKDADPTYVLKGMIKVSGGYAPETIPVTVETEDGGPDVTEDVRVENGKAMISIKCGEHHPARVIVDKFFSVPHAGGTPFTVNSFWSDIEHVLIVYGTEADAAANTECARDLAETLHKSWVNEPVPVVSDVEVTDDQLRSAHILLVGTPRTNKIAGRFASVFPVEFGMASFKCGGRAYGDPKTAVIASGDNPLSPKFGFYLFAGNSSVALYKLTGERQWLPEGVSAVVWPKGGSSVPLLTYDAASTKVFAE